MNEPELDDLLRRYRPAGPQPALRARVIAGVPPARRAWPWAAAAAVLLAATVYLNRSAERSVASANIRPEPDARGDAISLMSDMLGGDAFARLVAELTVSADEMRAERDHTSSLPALERR